MVMVMMNDDLDHDRDITLENYL